jgi:hypothetical protein
MMREKRFIRLNMRLRIEPPTLSTAKDRQLACWRSRRGSGRTVNVNVTLRRLREVIGEGVRTVVEAFVGAERLHPVALRAQHVSRVQRRITREGRRKEERKERRRSRRGVRERLAGK